MRARAPAFSLLVAVAGLAACGRTSLLPFDDERSDAGTEDTPAHDFYPLNREPFRKIDLLFVIDNSISMLDKQRIFAETVPVLLRRLVSPLCIDAEGRPTGDFSPCPIGAAEFRAIDDIHVGVITSSLGSHGGQVCTDRPDDSTPRTHNDRAQLLPSVRDGLYSYQGAGFLVWDPRRPRPFPDPHPAAGEHETNLDTFIADFASQVAAIGEHGCGYEAPHEAWYRFLVDPEPVAELTSDGVFSVRGPLNQAVLEQRARFLRRDSLVAIVVLTEENDCSIVDENGQSGWRVGHIERMPRATSQCGYPGSATFRCCRPCGTELEGCPPSSDDSECLRGPLAPTDDTTNLRCFQQKRRFGIDLLYPTARYVTALTRPSVTLRDGSGEVVNPLFAPNDDGTPAPDRRAFLLGLVGVPWQDLARTANLTGRELEYLDSDELSAGTPTRWDVILGDPPAGVEPLDPFMLESIDERSGRNPLTGDVIEPPWSGRTNAINGHEQNVPLRDDLQYACTFPLPAPIACSADNQDGCDCNAVERDLARPLCEYPTPDGDGVQIRGKAYPGTRHLEVLKGLGQNGIVASICPKHTAPEGSDPSVDPAYGYNPAVGALLDRVKPYLVPRCLPRPFELDANGRLPCSVIEGHGAGGACACDEALGRRVPEASLDAAVREELRRRGLCGGGSARACDEICLCEVRQFSREELAICRNQPGEDLGLYGFCYVDESGNPDLVAACPAEQRQDLRFLGRPERPSPAFDWIVCPRP